MKKIKGTPNAPYINRYLAGDRAVEVKAASLGKWEAVLLDTSEFAFGRFIKSVPVQMARFDEDTADTAARQLLAA